MIVTSNKSKRILWMDAAPLASMSAILQSICNNRNSFVNAFVVSEEHENNMAYLIVRRRNKSVYYRKMPELLWKMIIHCLVVPSSTCVCKLCVWRKKRSKFEISEFDHVTVYLENLCVKHQKIDFAVDL